MLKSIFCFLLTSTICFSTHSQTENELNKNNVNSKPKLVIGIVVDQMRYDYLTRFENKYSEGGFKRMMNEGFNCKNNHFNYIPTKTGPGHASVFTGTTPKYHGILGNDWYEKYLKKNVNCVSDETVQSVGTKSKDGKKSPHRMLATTFSDENKLFTQMRGKAIGMSLKHRGAILPVGHTANGAYWFDYEHNGTGNWITSTYYMEKLPKWVKEFNNSDITESYFREWNTLYDIESYVESGDDLNNYEKIFKGKTSATFPYDLYDLKEKNGKYNIIAESAYGNNLLTDFAIAAIDGEDLGKDNVTDVLTISYSSTDKVGHRFGVNSKEIQDTYLRLDLDLERLFKVLDDKVGMGEYTVFLTADHGVVDVPMYLKSVKIPAGYIDNKSTREKLNAFMLESYGDSGLIEKISNEQIFLDREKIKVLGFDLETIQESIVNEIINYDDVDKAYSASTMSRTNFTAGIEVLLQNGYNQKRSGDVLIVSKPGYISYGKKGTTHGSGNNYDTHVPLLFFGKGIKNGETLQRTLIPDIAPTISALLGISFPNASTGKPLEFVID